MSKSHAKPLFRGRHSVQHRHKFRSDVHTRYHLESGSIREQMNPEYIGGYEILGELGRGAMGVVYRAHDKGIDRAVAIKVMRVDTGASTRENVELRQRLIREASVAGKISHPGIVTVYQLGEEGENIFIVMEYVEGSSLDTLLVNKKGRDIAWALDVLSQIAVALDYAHQTNVVHRDIKPANILVRSDGRVKIADFGIAKMTAGSTTGLTVVGASVGSPAYMSPEQVQATQIDGRSDQFALGTIAFLMFTGRMPFRGETTHSLMYQIVTGDPFEPQPGDLPLSPEVRAVLARALAKHPRDRYEDCASFLHELSAAVHGVAASQSPAPQVAPPATDIPPPISVPPATTAPPIAPPPISQPPISQPPRPPSAAQAPVKTNLLLPIAAGVMALLVLIGGGAYWYTQVRSSSPVPSAPDPKQVSKDSPAPSPSPAPAPSPVPAPADDATPLLTAISKGDINQVRSLVDGGANVNEAGRDGVTPLIAAVAHERLDAAQLLIEHGADVNLADSSRNTPLMVAADTSPEIKDPAPLIRLLLTHGAKRGLKDSQGRIAFQRAVVSKNSAAVQLLR
jgi:serine/threonine protein kinase